MKKFGLVLIILLLVIPGFTKEVRVYGGESKKGHLHLLGVWYCYVIKSPEQGQSRKSLKGMKWISINSEKIFDMSNPFKERIFKISFSATQVIEGIKTTYIAFDELNTAWVIENDFRKFKDGTSLIKVTVIYKEKNILSELLLGPKDAYLRELVPK